MPSYHCTIKTGGKGAASDHAQYIAREGRFAEGERYGALEDSGSGNMPEWARGNPAAFWKASDRYERENGNSYREFELALPRELERGHQIALMQRFIEQELGNRHAYQWALHVEEARDGGEQPHVHLMFSDRINDGIERGPEQYFKRANRKNPEKGGCLKLSYGADRTAAAETYRGIRARWAQVQNLALQERGIEARVDHRSLAEQGITHREPGRHQGPAVAGIEARGEASEVGSRQRQEMAERQAARDALMEEARQIERQEEAEERQAARARRGLLPLVVAAPEEDRVALAQQLNRDWQAQLERTAVAAQLRTERREAALKQAKPQQIPLMIRLVKQARALQQRLGQMLESGRDWIKERFKAVLERALGRAQPIAPKVQREPAAGSNEAVVREFKTIAQNRAFNRPGYTDRSVEWQAMPEALRKHVLKFNLLDPRVQDAALHALAQNPVVVRGLRDLIQEFRQQERGQERGR